MSKLTTYDHTVQYSYSLKSQIASNTVLRGGTYVHAENVKRSEYAVSVFAKLCDDRVVLIQDPKCPSEWKLPGGRGEKDETPEETAVRELEEETGIKVKEEDLSLLYQEWRSTHAFSLFFVEDLSGQFKINKVGNEGEVVKLFTEFPVNFFRPHRKILQKMKMLSVKTATV